MLCPSLRISTPPTLALPPTTHTLPAVAVIDPLLVVEPERLATAAPSGTGDALAVQPYVTVDVPFRLLALLNQGRLELADHDDPGKAPCDALQCCVLFAMRAHAVRGLPWH